MTRRGFLRGLLGATLAGFFVSLYAFFVEPALRLRVQRWKILRADWTASPLRLVADGITVLSNAALRLGRYWIAGVEDQLAFPPRDGFGWQGMDDLPGTLAQITDDAPVVVLAHEPDIFARMPNRVALTLSGHIHGGQVRFFGWSPVVPSRFGNRYAYGHVHEGGRDLVVSGGIGCSILPVRFGVVPEITVIEIG